MNKLRDRNKLPKNKKIVILCFVLMFITIGFAALSATLGIISQTKIAKMSWNVHFEDLEVARGSVTPVTPATINDTTKTEINFGVDFTIPGQYYEFDVDVVNSGTINAKLSSITLSGITDEQLRYLRYSLKYADGKEIKENDALPSGERDRIRVRLEVRTDINIEDLPTAEASLTPKLEVVYVQDRGEGVQRDKLYRYKLLNLYAPLDNMQSEYVASATGIDFGSSPSDTNGKGLYVRAGTEEDEYPIFYYRGDVKDNNVLFAGYCWKIVRTTETGGTKLIYNGIPDNTNRNGTCANTGKASEIVSMSYNNLADSPAYVGYMYNSIASSKYTVSEKVIKTTSSNSKNNTPIYRALMFNNLNYYVSEFYSVNGNTYTLTNPVQLGKWLNVYNQMKGYYTCNYNVDRTCTTLYYIIAGEKGYMYSLALTNGKTIEQVNTNLVLGSEIIDNGDGTYSLSGNIINAKKEDWYANYKSYKNNFICSDYMSTTCSEMYYLIDTTKYQMTYEQIGQEMVFGNDVRWNGSSYELVDTYTKPAIIPYSVFYNNSNIRNKHYTCWSSENTCGATVDYVHYGNSLTPYKITLSDGKKVENALNEMFPEDNDLRNETDSAIKNYIENTWFEKPDGMASYVKYLEDTVWCNDRSISSLGGWNKDNMNISSWLSFGAYSRGFNQNKPRPSLKTEEVCPNALDRFTVNSSNGNGKLKYPVGLLTIDETTIAGNTWGNSNELSYLSSGEDFWTLSPHPFYYNVSLNFAVNSSGKTYNANVTYNEGVRPAISLNKNVTISSGNGTASNPYVIDNIMLGQANNNPQDVLVK